jgi:regulator of protease activity HflC (stomatin/prohibitin superfamily)
MSLFTRLTVPAGQRGLVYRDGTVDRVLPRVRTSCSARSRRLRRDEERLFALAPQDVLTADAVSLRVTVTLRIAVTDRVTFTENTADPAGAVYLATQIALRDNVSGVTAEDVTRRNDRIDGAVLLAATRPRVSAPVSTSARSSSRRS